MSSPLPLFILDGNGPCLNRGCEAILRTTLTILDTALGKARYISSPGSGPSEMDSRTVVHPDLVHLPASKPLTSVWGRLRQRTYCTLGINDNVVFQPYLTEATAVLELGGDNLTLDYGVPQTVFRRMEAIRRHGKPIIIWGASIGPFSEEPELERRYISWLKQTELILVRETETQNYLASNGVTKNVRLVADPAFLLEPAPTSLPVEQTVALGSGCAVGLNLSPLFGRYLDGPSTWVVQARDLLRSVDQHVDCPIFLIPHVIKPNNNDHAFLSDVLSATGTTKNPIYLLDSSYDACQTKWIIAQLSMFIGARTHSTIASLSSEVPTISLGYSAKARGINQDIFGHLRWLVPLHELTQYRLSEVLEDLSGNLVAVRHELRQKMPSYRQQSLNSGQILYDFLAS